MTAIQPPIKQLPLGIADFGRIVREGYYYVDKTMFIPRLEMASSYLFLVRPRRFGKSLLLSMLKCYYDINLKDRFDEYFGQLWIGSHPTPYRNRYAVLHLDFSQVTGTIDSLEENFYNYCNYALDTFAERYKQQFGPGFSETIKADRNVRGKLSYIGMQAKEHDVPLYLIVDEYDNFTNTVLNQHGQDIYTGLTHGEGFYRDIFKLFKPNFERVLMLGVSPVTMDDLTSGYNIATNITADPQFNQMLGFSEDDVRQMFLYYQQQAGWLKGDVEAMIQEMKPWYDGYCFAKDSLATESKMFNTDMVLYYLGSQIRFGHAPESMLNPNARTDYQKMKNLIMLDKLEKSRKSIIYEIAETGGITANLVGYFPASEMVKRENFVSLLYYYGMLTIQGSDGFSLRLGIPNNNVRKQYYKYLLEEYDRIYAPDRFEVKNLFKNAAAKGEWQPLLQLIADEYHKTSSVRSLIEGERNIQGFFTAYLNLVDFYLTAPEVELNHGYCDFFLMPDLQRYPLVAHSYIIELKYLKKDDTQATADEQWQDAHAQLRRYVQDEKVRLLVGSTQLHLVAVQFRGDTIERMEEIS
jgi:hypothetical protein